MQVEKLKIKLPNGNTMELIRVSGEQDKVIL
jgi:hypothetical protein